MSVTENVILTALVLLAPLGLFYSWYFYCKWMSWKESGWRGRTTLAALVLISIAVLLWPINRMTMPRADWISGVGVGEQVRWVDVGERIALGILLAALVICFFGRPRLILPLMFACVGTALFWMLSNAP